MEFPEPIVIINDNNNFLVEIENILSWAKSNPDKDYLCGIIKYERDQIETLNPKKYSTNGVDLNGEKIKLTVEIFAQKIEENYIAGSVALHQFIQYISKVTNMRYLDWSPNDTDIFLLNKSLSKRLCLASNVELIHTRADSIESLLTSFDLPVCRVAIDFKQNIYFTAQALFSVIKGYMNLPSYIRTADTWKQFTRDKCLSDGVNKIYNNYHDRLNKYWARGFRPKWFESDEVHKWIYGRMEYLNGT